MAKPKPSRAQLPEAAHPQNYLKANQQLQNGLADTITEVTDGTVTARAVTFHSVENNLIRRQVEYWPDPYAPPQWRSQWVRVVDDFPF